jgi:putative DNA primase/helicase
VNDSTVGNPRQQLLTQQHEAGFKLLKLREDKKPEGKEWQKRTRPLAEILTHAENGGGVGVQVGEVSDWIAAADLDCGEAEKLAPYFLPDTLKIKKGGELPSVYIYRSEGLPYACFDDPGVDTDKRLLDIKASANGKGHHVVVPPSMHAQKGQYQYVGGFDPEKITEIDKADIRRRVGQLVATALIARNLPATGRHDFMKALYGFTLRHGEEPQTMLKILRLAWQLKGAPSEAFEDIKATLPDTLRRLESNGEPVMGGHKLEEMVPGLSQALSKALGWASYNLAAGDEPQDGCGGGAETLPAISKLSLAMRCTDLGNSVRFVDKFSEQVIHCMAIGGFGVWDGSRFEPDESNRTQELAKQLPAEIVKASSELFSAGKEDQAKKHFNWALKSGAGARVAAALTLAKSDPRIAVRTRELDCDPLLLNVLNGTVVLRTGELRPHDPADRLTKLAPVNFEPDSPAPIWDAFLKEILPSEALRRFVQKWVGYCLTGLQRDQILPIFYGVGANGKSTFINLIIELLGDYAQNAAPELLMSKGHENHPTERADLFGRRLVVAVETEENKRLSESFVKMLTGGERIRARHMRQDFFEFDPTHHVILITNHKPVVRGTDHAIWRRLRLVPFDQTFEESAQDKELPEKLKREMSGVLNWAIEGCLAWQEEGLKTPEEILSATSEYREDQDVLGTFIAECCDEDPQRYTPIAGLWRVFEEWARTSGERPGSKKKLSQKLGERGYRADRKGRARVFFGLVLREEAMNAYGNKDND